MSSFSMVRRVALAGLTLFGTAAPVMAEDTEVTVTVIPAADPSAAAAAQEKADAARTRAEDLTKFGGWGYKSGWYDHATAEAAFYQAKADSLTMAPPAASTPAEFCPVPADAVKPVERTWPANPQEGD